MANLKQNYFISTYLDTRKAKSNGKFPLKLRVFTKTPRKQKLYSTSFEFTKDEFAKIENATKTTSSFYKVKLQLSEVVSQAYQVADKLPVFSFKDFERLLFNNNGSTVMNVNYYYQKAIENYKQNQQFGTASSYDLSLKSLLKFHDKDTLDFADITPEWLNKFQRYMTDNPLKPKSITTVGIYLRPLRAIFNTAIDEKSISPDLYPFGMKKYKIPAPKGVKKALTESELKLLWQTETDTPDQQKAKDFWFFSFFCNGMNPKDIAQLKNKDLKNNVISFTRSKTARTTSSPTSVSVYLNDHAKAILNKYRTDSTKKNDFIFPIINPKSSPEKQRYELQNFIRFVNYQMLKFGHKIGLEDDLSLMWARHTFATYSIRKGVSMELISEAMAHTNLQTTKRYFAGFNEVAKKELADKLMEF